MADVVNFPKPTRLNLPVERVMKLADEANLIGCVIVGVNADGEEFFASTYADGGDALWRLARAQKALLEVPETFRGTAD